MSSSAPSYFPGNDVYDTSKDQEKVGKQCLDYAIDRWRSKNWRRQKMRRLFDSYSGLVDSRSMNWLNSMYGAANVTKYIDYRLSKTLLDKLRGEWIKLPMKSSVFTTNKEAKVRALDNYELHLGIYHSKEQLSRLQENLSISVFENQQIPNYQSEADVRQELNKKSQNERIMQYVINKQLRSVDLRTKLESNYLDMEVVAECHGKVFLDSNGRVDYREIDPRNAIYEELERDPFLKLTPYEGEHRIMFYNDIIKEFSLNDTQLRQLKMYNENPSKYIEDFPNDFKMVGQDLGISVYSIEWKAIKSIRTKYPKNSDGSDAGYSRIMSEKYYRDNKDKVESEVKKGKTSIKEGPKETLWEATRIGCEIYTDIQEVENIIGSIENPYPTKANYVHVLFTTRDGIRISLQETCENINRIFNFVMFQINRELTKAKGKVVIYDKRWLPKGKTMNDVLYQMTNDSIMYVDSSEDGKEFGGSIEIHGGFREFDLGISQSVAQLINLKMDLQNTLYSLTGINPNRMGDIPASSTATNAQSAIMSSQTITASMEFYFERFIEEILVRICELTKISWGILRKEEGSLIVGDDGVEFLRVNRKISFDDYGCYFESPRREQEIRQKYDMAAMASLNAKELRPEDYLESQMAETMVDALAVIKRGWKTVRDTAQQEAMAIEEKRNEGIQAQIAGNKEAIEDNQLHEKELKAMDIEGKMAVQNQKGQMDYVTKRRLEEDKNSNKK